ncbi:hypothetical protein ACEPAH_1172 [Sanghuangporus vaninii]
MSANPCEVVLGLSLVGGIGTILGVFYTPPENSLLKHTFWVVSKQGVVGKDSILRVSGIQRSLAYVGATAKNETYLYMGGPLLAGLTAVALSSLAPLVLPLGVRGLSTAEAISLYGGLAVISGFMLFDTQKILAHARAAEAGLVPRDLVEESIALELDFINIFIRIVQILMLSQVVVERCKLVLQLSTEQAMQRSATSGPCMHQFHATLIVYLLGLSVLYLLECFGGMNARENNAITACFKLVRLGLFFWWMLVIL